MKDFLIALSLGFLIGAGVIMTWACHSDSVEPYKRGQIDALTGKIKYELITETNTTVLWKPINKK